MIAAGGKVRTTLARAAQAEAPAAARLRSAAPAAPVVPEAADAATHPAAEPATPPEKIALLAP